MGTGMKATLGKVKMVWVTNKPAIDSLPDESPASTRPIRHVAEAHAVALVSSLFNFLFNFLAHMFSPTFLPL